MPKARAGPDLPLSEADTTERVRAVVDRLLGRPSSRNALTSNVPALDVSKPTIHDSKAEFQAELTRINRALVGLRDAQEQLLGPEVDDDRDQQGISLQARSAIDQSARRAVAPIVEPQSAIDLLRKNSAQVGFFISSQWCLIDLIAVLEQRLAELNDQGKEFWSVKNRAPNYHARAVALRLARIYAREKQKKPTIGTARDGGHPSTDFGRALEEIFAIIGVRAHVRRAAEWAIGELTEEDFRAPALGLGRGLMPTGRARSIPESFLLELRERLSKGDEQ